MFQEEKEVNQNRNEQKLYLVGECVRGDRSFGQLYYKEIATSIFFHLFIFSRNREAFCLVFFTSQNQHFSYNDFIIPLHFHHLIFLFHKFFLLANIRTGNFLLLESLFSSSATFLLLYRFVLLFVDYEKKTCTRYFSVILQIFLCISKDCYGWCQFPEQFTFRSHFWYIF